MTKDEIIRMAREVVEKELVAAAKTEVVFAEAYRCGYAAGAAAEREACAEVCKKHADVYENLEQNPTAQSAWAACIDNRDAIRARGTT